MKCKFCGNEATLLCDGLLPRWLNNPLLRDAATPRNWKKGIEIRRQMLTCDRHICKNCATSGGRFHVSAGDDGYFDTIDYCPDCKPQIT